MKNMLSDMVPSSGSQKSTLDQGIGKASRVDVNKLLHKQFPCLLYFLKELHFPFPLHSRREEKCDAHSVSIHSRVRLVQQPECAPRSQI